MKVNSNKIIERLSLQIARLTVENATLHEALAVAQEGGEEIAETSENTVDAE